MKKKRNSIFTIVTAITALALGVFAVGASPVSAADWGIDGAHSSVSFSVSHMVISETTGKFTDFAGSASFDTTDMSGASAELTIQVASLTTENTKRDDHLRSGDFFDVEKFPTITFVTTKITLADDGALSVVGDMTMKGVTNSVTFTGKLRGIINDPWGNTRAGLTLSATIDRTDFDVNWSKPLDGGGLLVGHDVDMTLEFELVQTQPEEEADADAEDATDSD
ncbi:polyisoprenoid-binding protein [Gemmatimonas aurantiaca]|nr:polyisoprenoid-binding protein [Gemmatimonas aurantiaca]